MQLVFHIVTLNAILFSFRSEVGGPGQQKLAEDMGSGERSIRTYLKELEDAKFLEVTQRGLGKTNLYRLFLTVKKQGHSKPARPDRQILPVKNGKGFRS